MGERKYIGARYVPLILGAWDNSIAYEPLTQVTYDGDTYTSIMYVPEGVDIFDSGYWVCTSSYNSRWYLFKSEMEAIIAQLQSDWEEYQTNLNAEWAAYQEDLNSQWETYQTNLNAEWETYQTNLNAEWEAFKEAYAEEWAEYQETLEAAWEAYQTALNAEWAAWQETMEAAWEAYQTALNAEWAAYQEELNSAWATYQETMNTAWSTFQSDFETEWEQFQSDYAAEWSEYKNSVDGTLSTYYSEYTTYISAFEVLWATYKTEVQAALDAFAADWATYQSTIEETLAIYVSDYQSYISAFETSWSEYQTTISELLASYVSDYQSYISAFETSWSEYQTTIEETLASYVSTYESYISDFETSWSEYQETITETVRNNYNSKYLDSSNFELVSDASDNTNRTITDIVIIDDNIYELLNGILAYNVFNITNNEFTTINENSNGDTYRILGADYFSYEDTIFGVGITRHQVSDNNELGDPFTSFIEYTDSTLTYSYNNIETYTGLKFFKIAANENGTTFYAICSNDYSRIYEFNYNTVRTDAIEYIPYFYFDTQKGVGTFSHEFTSVNRFFSEGISICVNNNILYYMYKYNNYNQCIDTYSCETGAFIGRYYFDYLGDTNFFTAMKIDHATDTMYLTDYNNDYLYKIEAVSDIFYSDYFFNKDYVANNMYVNHKHFMYTPGLYTLVNNNSSTYYIPITLPLPYEPTYYNSGEITLNNILNEIKPVFNIGDTVYINGYSTNDGIAFYVTGAIVGSGTSTATDYCTYISYAFDSETNSLKMNYSYSYSTFTTLNFSSNAITQTYGIWSATTDEEYDEIQSGDKVVSSLVAGLYNTFRLESDSTYTCIPTTNWTNNSYIVNSLTPFTLSLPS